MFHCTEGHAVTAKAEAVAQLKAKAIDLNQTKPNPTQPNQTRANPSPGKPSPARPYEAHQEEGTARWIRMKKGEKSRKSQGKRETEGGLLATEVFNNARYTAPMPRIVLHFVYACAHQRWQRCLLPNGTTVKKRRKCTEGKTRHVIPTFLPVMSFLNTRTFQNIIYIQEIFSNHTFFK